MRSALDIAQSVRSGGSAREAVEATVAAVAARNEELNVFLHVDADAAYAEADAIDARVAAGEDPGILAGVPVAIKDNICQTGVPTTCSSKILEGWRPPYNATVIDRLRAAGAIPFGKTNLDEFAMGSSTENSAYGPTRNPLDPSRVPGGSSGGSAAAVAANMTPLSLGSDTGGSIRQPAALCGLVGVKPTYGLVSRYGLIAFASSLDQIGPFAHSVTDAALLLEAISGHDPLDSTSVPEPAPSLVAHVNDGVAGKHLFLRQDLIHMFGEALEVVLVILVAKDTLREDVKTCKLKCLRRLVQVLDGFVDVGELRDEEDPQTIRALLSELELLQDLAELLQLVQPQVINHLVDESFVKIFAQRCELQIGVCRDLL